MSKVYKRPELCNYYCTHECEIGKLYIPEVSVKELNQITLEMLATLNDMAAAISSLQLWIRNSLDNN